MANWFDDTYEDETLSPQAALPAATVSPDERFQNEFVSTLDRLQGLQQAAPDYQGAPGVERGLQQFSGGKIEPWEEFQARQDRWKAEQPKPEQPIFGLGDVASAAGGFISALPTTGTEAFYRMKEFGKRPDQFSPEAQAAFAESRALQERMAQEQAEREKAGTSTAVGQAIREATSSSGYTLGSMLPALAGGVAGAKGGAALGALAGPAGAGVGGVVGGILGGFAGSGAAAYTMSQNQFMEDAFREAEQRMQQKQKRSLNEQEKQALYQEMEPIARDNALWEAGPEAVGNAFMLVGGGIAAGLLGKQGISKLAAGAMRKGMIRAGAGATGTGMEFATETATELGQALPRARMEAYLEGKPMEDAVSRYAGKPLGGAGAAFEEIWRPTLGTLLMFGLGGSAVKGVSKANERFRQNPQEAEAIVEMANKPDVLAAMPQQSLENLQELSGFLRDQWFAGTERQQNMSEAIAKISAELQQRTNEDATTQRIRQETLGDLWTRMAPQEQSKVLEFFGATSPGLTGWTTKEGTPTGQIDARGLNRLANTLGVDGKRFRERVEQELRKQQSAAPPTPTPPPTTAPGTPPVPPAPAAGLPPVPPVKVGDAEVAPVTPGTQAILEARRQQAAEAAGAPAPAQEPQAAESIRRNIEDPEALGKQMLAEALASQRAAQAPPAPPVAPITPPTAPTVETPPVQPTAPAPIAEAPAPIPIVQGELNAQETPARIGPAIQEPGKQIEPAGGQGPSGPSGINRTQEVRGQEVQQPIGQGPEGELTNAQQIPAASAPNGSGGPRPEIRQESRGPAEGGKGIQPGGQGGQVAQPRNEEKASEVAPAPPAIDLGGGAAPAQETQAPQYPNRKLKLDRARTDFSDEFNQDAWANVALANMEAGESIKAGNKQGTVKKITNNRITITWQDGDKIKDIVYSPGSKNWESLVRDLGDSLAQSARERQSPMQLRQISGKPEADASGQAFDALLRDPAFRFDPQERSYRLSDSFVQKPQEVIPTVSPTPPEIANAKGQAETEAEALLTPGQPPASTGAAAAPSKPGKKVTKLSTDEIAKYFSPGRVVPSYGGGRDKVVSFNRTKDGWYATVYAVDAEGNRLDGPDGRDRSHKTMPSVRDYEQVVGEKATGKPLKVQPKSAVAPSTPAQTQKVKTPDEQMEVDVGLEVVELADLITSDDARFPKSLQPRGRGERQASTTQVFDIAKGLNPDRLLSSPVTSDGAPIVGPDGLVESGNGRVMAIRTAYGQFQDRANAYRAKLQEQGFDTTGMTAPVLIRRRVSPLDDAQRIEFTQKSNMATVASMSPSERARLHAKRLLSKPAVLDAYRGGDPGLSVNAEFVRRFFQEVLDPSERGQFQTKEGLLNAEGNKEIQSAILAAAYPDVTLLDTLLESQDNNIKTIGGALREVAPDILQTKAYLRQYPELQSLDLSVPLTEAAQLVNQARTGNKGLKDILDQQGMFGGIDSTVERLARLFFSDADLRKGLSQPKLVRILQSYAENARRIQPSDPLFDDIPQITVGDLLSTMEKRREAELPAEQADLLGGGAARPSRPESRAGDQRPSANRPSAADGAPGPREGQEDGGKPAEPEVAPAPKAEVKPEVSRIPSAEVSLLKLAGYTPEAIEVMSAAERAEAMTAANTAADGITVVTPTTLGTQAIPKYVVASGETNAMFGLYERARGSFTHLTNLATTLESALQKAKVYAAARGETQVYDFSSGNLREIQRAAREQDRGSIDRALYGEKGPPVEGAVNPEGRVEPSADALSVDLSLLDDDALLRHFNLDLQERVARSGKTYWAITGATERHKAMLDALGFKDPFKMDGVYWRSVFKENPKAKLVEALRAGGEVRIEPRPTLPRAEAEQVLTQAGLVVTQNPNNPNRWTVEKHPQFKIRGGNNPLWTYKDLLADLGGVFNRSSTDYKVTYRVFDYDPTEALGYAIANFDTSGSVARDAQAPGRGGNIHDDPRIRELRQRLDARDDRRLGAGEYRRRVSDDTQRLITEGGDRFHVPKQVQQEQIEDVGMIVRAFDEDAPAFILANAAGTGKTMVMGGAIRELRRLGHQKFVYVTQSRDLIEQIKTDLAAYGVDDVIFHTYAEMSGDTRMDVAGAVIFFDEAHNIKNINDNTARALKGQDLIKKARMSVFASATPFENPVQAAYLGATGLFDQSQAGEVSGFPFIDWVAAFGAEIETFEYIDRNTGRKVTRHLPKWRSSDASKEDAKASREWLAKQGILTQRPMRINPDMVDVEFSRTEVDPYFENLYNEIDNIYDDALIALESGEMDMAQTMDGKMLAGIAMHRENLIKRILEASKVPAAIQETRKLLDAGQNVVIFVETKADRSLNRWRKTEGYQKEYGKDEKLYTYLEMQSLMEAWQREADAWVRTPEELRGTFPKPPFADFIYHLAGFFHQQYGDKAIELPSTADEIVKAFGKKNVGIYTGAVGTAAANKAKEKFLAGELKILVATMAKGGTGLSLHDKVGNRPTTQLNINLPWTATQVEQVMARVARYGLQSKALVRWMFASNISWEADKLAPKVGARMRDMGATVQGIDVPAAEILASDFDFTGTREIAKRQAAEEPGRMQEAMREAEDFGVVPPAQPAGEQSLRDQFIESVEPDLVLSPEQQDLLRQRALVAYQDGDLTRTQYAQVLEYFGTGKFARIAEILDEVQRTGRQPGVAFARTTQKAQMKADLRQMLALMSQSAYEGGYVQIAIKETLQNSFDAVKKIARSKGGYPENKGVGEILISINEYKRTISITDNGVGMTPKEIDQFFLTLGGTGKGGIGTSGGMGLAKGQFLTGSEFFELTTTKDGKRSVLRATPEEILSGSAKVLVDDAPKGEHGTTLTLKVPASYNTQDGDTRDVWFPSNARIDSFSQPLIGPVDIYVQRDDSAPELLPIGNNFDPEANGTPLYTKASFGWGDADIYFGISRKDRGVKHAVLSDGIYQFDLNLTTLDYKKVPYDVIVNIRSKVKSDDPRYPFNNTRQGFRATIAEDEAALRSYLLQIASGYQSNEVAENFKSLKQLPRVEVQGAAKEMSAEAKEAAAKAMKAYVQDSPKPVAPPQPPKKVEIASGKVESVEVDPKKPGAESRNTLVDIKAEKENIAKRSFEAEKNAAQERVRLDEQLDRSRPVFHNNTSVDYISEFGETAAGFFSELGSVMVEFIETFGEIGGWGYQSFQKNKTDSLVFGGISIDKGYRGVHVKVPYTGIFVNPLAVGEAKSLPGFAAALYLTMVHEVAHTNAMNHNEQHTLEIHNVYEALADRGLDLEFQEKIGNILYKYRHVYNPMREKFNESSTKNVAQSLSKSDREGEATAQRMADLESGYFGAIRSAQGLGQRGLGQGRREQMERGDNAGAGLEGRAGRADRDAAEAGVIDQRRYSRTADTLTEVNLTQAQARAEAVEALGETNVRHLERNGFAVWLEPKPGARPLPGNNRMYLSSTGQEVVAPADAQAFVDKGVVHLIPSNMRTGALNALLHESAHLMKDERFSEGDRTILRLSHAVLNLSGLRNFIGNPGFQDLAEQVQRMAREGNSVALKALAQAQARDPNRIAEESVAYLVEYGDPNLPIVRRILAAIRAALYRMGVKMELRPEDVRQLAISALKARAQRNKIEQRKLVHLAQLENEYEAKYGDLALGELRVEVLRNIQEDTTLEQFRELVTRMLERRYSYAGLRAATADLGALQQAKLRVENGEDAETVRQETGWFLNPHDKKWRFEIDDSQATLQEGYDNGYVNGEPRKTILGNLFDVTEKITNPYVIEARGGATEYTSPGILKHDWLQKAYPEIADIRVEIHESSAYKKSASGHFNTVKKEISLLINPKIGGNSLKSLLHEVQHAVQEFEGFAKGGAPNEFLAQKDPIKAYKSLAGEIEARDVESRSSLSPEQRRATPPYRDTMFKDGIADEDVIVNVDGQRFSRAPAIEVSEATMEEFEAIRALFQARQAKTPFRQWFGKGTPGVTATVDGTPITLYHGTNNPLFTEWDSSRAAEASGHPTSGLGFFMTADKRAAARYGNNLLELHAKIEKPYYLTDADLTGIETRQDAERLRWNLMKQGYDGAVVEAPGAPHANYVIAFKPNQIKFTTTEKPTASPDMRYSRQPVVETEGAQSIEVVRDNIVRMIPKVYLSLAMPFGYQGGPKEDTKKVNKLAEIPKWDTRPMLSVKRNELGQLQIGLHDGRHRALAAMVRGDAFIDVEIVRAKRFARENPDISDADLAHIFTNTPVLSESGDYITVVKNTDIRYSLQPVIASDAKYLAAVERGDMETAQRMVDDAAKKAGYDVVWFHNPRSRKWTEVQDAPMYFAKTQRIGDVFSWDASSTRRFYINIPENKIAVGEDMSYIRSKGDPRVQRLLKAGYLAATGKIRGLEQAAEGVWDLSAEEKNELVVLDPIGRVKSADPVTYDDAGNVIPLSQRFDATTSDIRYSRQPPGQPPTPADAQNFLNDIGGMDMEPQPNLIKRIWRNPAAWRQELMRGFTDTAGNTRPAWTRMLSRQQIVEMLQESPIAALSKLFEDTARLLDAEKQAGKHVPFDIAKRWREAAAKSRDKGRNFAKLLFFTTLEHVDPTQPLPERDTFKDDRAYLDAKQSHARATQMLNDLRRTNPVMADLYKEVMDENRRSFDAYHRALQNRLSRGANGIFNAMMDRAKDVTPTGTPKTLTQRLANLANADPAAYDAFVDAVRQRLANLKMEAADAQAIRDTLPDAEQKALLDDIVTDVRGKIKDSMDSLRFIYEQARILEPYFPLSRWGDYQVYAEKAGEPKPIFSSFTRQQDQRAAIAQLQKEGWTVKVGYDIKDALTANPPADSFLGKMFVMVDEIVSTKKEAAALKDEFYQMYLRSLPELSSRKHFLHRKGIPGFSMDALRGFAQLANSRANSIARLNHSDTLSESLVEMERTLRRAGRDPNQAEAINRAGALLGELQGSYEWMMNPTNATWANRLTSFGFLWHLTNPSTALINLTQLPIATFPALAAQFKAPGRAFSALNKTIKDYGGWKFHGKVAKEDARQRLFAEYDGDLGRMMESPLISSQISRTEAVALAGMSDDAPEFAGGVQGAAAELYRSALYYGGWLYQKAEVANREITVIAAYRMAREEAAAKGMTREQAHNYASEIAYNLMTRTQGDFSLANRPWFMRGNAMRVMFLFRSFAHLMTWNILRDAYQWKKGETPESRQIARDRLAWTGVSSLVFAGATGFPAYTIIAAIADAFWGSDPDDPWDFDTAVRNELQAYGGETFMRTVMSGPVGQTPRVLNLMGLDVRGVDIAPRLSLDLARLWFRRQPDDLEGGAAMDWWMAQVAGPLYGTARGMAEGMRYLGQASYDPQAWSRSIEGFTPAPIRNLAKSVRFKTEGVTSRQGDLLMDDFTYTDMLAQAIGFTPDELQDQYRTNTRAWELKTTIDKRRKNIYSLYIFATERGDAEMQKEAIGRVERWNQLNPEYPITYDNLRSSYQKFIRARALQEGGVFIPSHGLRARVFRDLTSDE